MSFSPTVYGQKPTPRELRVLALTAHGLTNLQIGHRLGLSDYTVATYLRRLFVKLGANNRAHVVTIGFVKGYLKLPARDGEVPS